METPTYLDMNGDTTSEEEEEDPDAYASPGTGEAAGVEEALEVEAEPGAGVGEASAAAMEVEAEPGAGVGEASAADLPAAADLPSEVIIMAVLAELIESLEAEEQLRYVEWWQRL